MENKNFTKAEGDLLKDGSLKFTMNPDHGYRGGYYVKIADNATEDEIQKAKEDVVDVICSEIRRIALEKEDFFIIKDASDGCGKTVAAKFELPTVKSI